MLAILRPANGDRIRKLLALACLGVGQLLCARKQSRNSHPKLRRCLQQEQILTTRCLPQLLNPLPNTPAMFHLQPCQLCHIQTICARSPQIHPFHTPQRLHCPQRFHPFCFELLPVCPVRISHPMHQADRVQAPLVLRTCRGKDVAVTRGIHHHLRENCLPPCLTLKHHATNHRPFHHNIRHPTMQIDPHPRLAHHLIHHELGRFGICGRIELARSVIDCSSIDLTQAPQ